MIEKNLFQSWYTNNLHPAIQKKINCYKTMNPEYTYHFYTDEDMDIFVNEHFKGEIADCYNKLNIIVTKVDFWRYLVLYKYGGVYLDMDSSIEYPLSELIKDDDEAIITAEGNPDTYVQWGLIFKKNHPILKKAIDLIIININNEINGVNCDTFIDPVNKVYYFTGPKLYTKAIDEVHKELFNNEIINHSLINRNTDITYQSDFTSYRLYGIDYNRFFNFKHDMTHFLYSNKIHWKDEVKKKSLLI